jgi:hypothetical protein
MALSISVKETSPGSRPKSVTIADAPSVQVRQARTATSSTTRKTSVRPTFTHSIFSTVP